MLAQTRHCLVLGKIAITTGEIGVLGKCGQGLRNELFSSLLKMLQSNQIAQ
jgi:hypothetical protein